MEDGSAIFAPPLFADCGVVVAELKEVAEDGDAVGNFGDVFDIRDVGAG